MTGAIRFGFATDTYDAEGEQVARAHEVKVTLEEVVDGRSRHL